MFEAGAEPWSARPRFSPKNCWQSTLGDSKTITRPKGDTKRRDNMRLSTTRPFGQTTRLAHGSASKAAPANSFGILQKRLVQNRLRSIDSIDHALRIRWAADEASSLAWTTGYPFLMFPALFEERAEAALDRARRQNHIHARSRELLGLNSIQSSR